MGHRYMHTIDTANAVGSQFVNRDEIVNVILGAGIQLDKSKHDQLKTAIAKYVTDLGTKILHQ